MVQHFYCISFKNILQLTILKYFIKFSSLLVSKPIIVYCVDLDSFGNIPSLLYHVLS